ncbi:hypothetical protein TNCV_4542881 [Trichonephila clavipes]|nr:hypothetical protein TNCV_4542881 [Trichonephila clavipes]
MESILWPYRESRKLQSTESDYRMRGQIDHPIDAHRPRFVHNRVLICNRDASECNNGRLATFAGVKLLLREVPGQRRGIARDFPSLERQLNYRMQAVSFHVSASYYKF